ncbi:MAG TPA: hypothetical protein QGF52_02600 [Nitrososphaerales archaeon]|nr:hypothetical protein [Nitrososphaerales archaeon]
MLGGTGGGDSTYPPHIRAETLLFKLTGSLSKTYFDLFTLREINATLYSDGGSGHNPDISISWNNLSQ